MLEEVVAVAVADEDGSAGLGADVATENQEGGAGLSWFEDGAGAGAGAGPCARCLAAAACMITVFSRLPLPADDCSKLWGVAGMKGAAAMEVLGREVVVGVVEAKGGRLSA